MYLFFLYTNVHLKKCKIAPGNRKYQMRFTLVQAECTPTWSNCLVCDCVYVDLSSSLNLGIRPNILFSLST